MQTQQKEIAKQDEMIDVLDNEITKIKYIALAINQETSEHNILLDNMNDDIDNQNLRLKHK